MTDLHVAVEDEWMRARELRLTALTAAPLAYLETLESALARDEEAWRERLRESPTRRQLIVRADDGTWVGSCVVFLDEGRAFVVGVWLDPAYRGTGVIDDLIGAQKEWARDVLGAERLWLHVGATNARARAAYERLGFRATGVIETFPPHPELEHEMVAEL